MCAYKVKKGIFVPGTNVALGRELMSKVAEQFARLRLEKLLQGSAESACGGVGMEAEKAQTHATCWWV